MFNGVKLNICACYLDFHYSVTNCEIVLSCDIVILNEEVSFKGIFSAALVKGAGEGCKTNLCFLNLFLRKTQVVVVFALRRTNLSKERVRLRNSFYKPRLYKERS